MGNRRAKTAIQCTGFGLLCSYAAGRRICMPSGCAPESGRLEPTDQSLTVKPANSSPPNRSYGGNELA
jgi:hypothetical protein